MKTINLALLLPTFQRKGGIIQYYPQLSNRGSDSSFRFSFIYSSSENFSLTYQRTACTFFSSLGL